MPISTAAPLDRGANRLPRTLTLPVVRGGALRGCAGFTLLELTLVLAILGVVMALTVPRLRDPGRSQLMAQGHRLVQIFQLLKSEAVLGGAAYRLNYDLDQQRYWVTPAEQVVDLAAFARDMGSLARGTQLEAPVGIMDVVLPTLAGKVAQGQIYTVFYPDGTIDPTVIHMGNGKEAWTLWLNPMNGRLRMDQGYREVEYAG